METEITLVNTLQFVTSLLDPENDEGDLKRATLLTELIALLETSR